MRRVVVASIAALLLLIASALGIAWHYAGEIEREALAVGPPPPPFDLVVAAVGDGEITLTPTESTNRNETDLDKPGRYGLASPDGRGGVGEILWRNGDSVTRALIGFDGDLAPGDRVRLRALAHSGDPRSELGLAFDDIAFESDVGRLGAWYVEGSSATWAIVVHGRGVGRSEGLKVLPALAELGLPTLVIQYRNDEGVARSASGFYDYGLSEWRDLEAAVAYALDRGAEDVVLIGNSMGGAIVVNFLYRSNLAGRVRGIVLDSPVLDFEDVVDFGAERRNLWSPITWLGKTASSFRSGITWRDFDYLEGVGGLAVPILLIHGDADHVVHVRTSDALAAARPDLVTYLRLDGVGHLRGWNTDPPAYQRALSDFLSGRLAVGGAVRMKKDNRTPFAIDIEPDSPQ